MNSIFSVNGLTVHYGAVAAVKPLTLNLNQNETLMILGANGAGKTSALKAMTGLLKPSGGTIEVNGSEAVIGNPRWFTEHGVVLVPEGVRNFSTFTVLENLLLPLTVLKRGDDDIRLAKVFDLFPVLADRKKQRAGTLSGGEQKMLAIGRGLMMAPRLLCIDEPTMGLAPIVIERVVESLKALVDDGIAIIVAEQRMAFAEAMGGRALIMENGEFTWHGSAEVALSTGVAEEALLGRSGRTKKGPPELGQERTF